jgi:hypothetical protein
MKVIPETRREHDNGVMTKANKKQHIFKNMFFKWRFDVPLSIIFQLYIVAISFIGGGNRSTRRKTPT